MAKGSNFFVRNYSGHVGATAFLVACMLSFIFIVIGTPLGVLKNRADPTICYTLWGTRKCSSPDYDYRVAWDTCYSRRVRFEFAEALSIAAMFFMVVNGIMCWYCIGGWNGKWWTFAASLVALASNFVPWTVVASVYHTAFCGSDTYTKAHTKYAPGFALLVTSFCVQCVGIVCLVALEPYVPVEKTGDKKKTEKAKGEPEGGNCKEPVTSQPQ
ncbi:Amastin surface glycoprotein [Trypanosoma melophagium]|uniref:Amastin surface glycoprotein n=1 Tax=Trypanosoma melophagium TaxID=715481 RepID=UPI00351A352F|nr:Amastin surface glycoprotein [Trypanosoma melophagium]